MKAQITFPNIKGFLQGNYRKVLEDLDFLPVHIKEQAAWRMSQVKEKSPECFNNDKCSHCGCQVSAKVFEDRGCSDSGKCYPPMMTEEQWKTFKEHFKID